MTMFHANGIIKSKNEIANGENLEWLIGSVIIPSKYAGVTMSPHAIYEAVNKVLGGNKSHFTTKVLLLSMRRMMRYNCPSQGIPDVLCWVKVWWSGWPFYSLNILTFQFIEQSTPIWTSIIVHKNVGQKLLWKALHKHIKPHPCFFEQSGCLQQTHGGDCLSSMMPPPHTRNESIGVYFFEEP